MEKEFMIDKSGISIGNLLCYYLRDDRRVSYAGYRCTREGNLIIKINTIEESADLCMSDAIKKCLAELDQLITNCEELNN